MTVVRILVRGNFNGIEKFAAGNEYESLAVVTSLQEIPENSTTNLMIGEGDNGGIYAVRQPIAEVEAAFKRAAALNVILIGEQESMLDVDKGSRYFLTLGPLADPQTQVVKNLIP